MLDNDIMEAKAEWLFNKEWLERLLFMKDSTERERLKAVCLIRAKELNVYKQLKDVFDEYEGLNNRLNKLNYSFLFRDIPLMCGNSGEPLPTIENFLTILKCDNYFSNIRFNQMKSTPEVVEDDIARAWTEADESRAKMYIETLYGIHNAKKFEDALKIFFSERMYNPLMEKIEGVQWDGVERIDTMLSKWLKAEDNPYTREVSRLIFSGGINRLYRPGCKFDDVPVLIGTKQGEGKSSFVRWLAMDDEYFAEVCDIEGQKGAEILCGAWICEIAELLALTKSREIEAVKAYLTKQSDKYREPYAKTTAEHQRQCIFIGTTNRSQFLTDRTGNRRFYPVVVNSRGFDLHNKKDELQFDIRQCWAEAKFKFDEGKMPPCVNSAIIDEARAKQESSAEDDYRIGMISEYLKDRQIVCGIELWQKALNNGDRKPSRKESNDIVLIMQGIDGWERFNSTHRFPEYGIQKGWRKKWEHI